MPKKVISVNKGKYRELTTYYGISKAIYNCNLPVVIVGEYKDLKLMNDDFTDEELWRIRIGAEDRIYQKINEFEINKMNDTFVGKSLTEEDSKKNKKNIHI